MYLRAFQKTLIACVIAPSLLFATSTIADVKDDVCAFKTSLAEQGPQAGIDKINEILQWNPKGAKQVTSAMASLMQFNFTKAEAFLVADFADLSKEFVVAASTAKNSVMYFRLRFQNIGGELRLYNLYFKNSYPEFMAKGAFAQKPEILNC